jgi:hypothetical protein
MATYELSSFKILAQYFGNDEEKFKHVLGLAIHSVEEAMVKIKTASKQKDEKLLRDGFHTLKGNLGHLELGLYLEKMPKYDDPHLYEVSPTYADQIGQEIQKIKSDLEL